MNTKLKCVLLDDELPGLAYLKMLCEQIPDVKVVKAFNDSTKFLNEIANLEFDFCILDIEMPNIDGLQIANLLKGKPFFFVTAYKEYASDAFDLNAIDYVRKPIHKDRLRQAIEKVKKNLTNTTLNEKKFAQLNTNKGKTILFFDTIAYIKTAENDSRDKVVTLFGEEEIIIKNITFSVLLKLLPIDQFCQINKSEIVAIKAIQVFSFDEITTTLLLDGKPLRLSLNENFRGDFLRKIRN
ncbi:MAG: response regulator transcription factor [Chitinophagales bacterium]|nr:response regulator transcription factor [Chitinophagales bacterium]